MPRGRKNVPVASGNTAEVIRPYYLPQDAKWGGFINLTLDEGQKAGFVEWYSLPSTRWDILLDEQTYRGMALSVKYDAENQCYTASLAGKGVSNSNERYCLTARAGSSLEAMALLVYKHCILMEGQWDHFVPTNGRLRQWG